MSSSSVIVADFGMMKGVKRGEDKSRRDVLLGPLLLSTLQAGVAIEVIKLNVNLSAGFEF